RFPEAGVRHLFDPHSDHTPILVKLDFAPPTPQRNKPFRFQAAWLTHEEFEPFLANSWRSDVGHLESLSQLVGKLGDWNKMVFGHIFAWNKSLWRQLEQIQDRISTRPSQVSIQLECDLREKLEEDNRNTRYYHLLTIIRRRMNNIQALQNANDVWVSDPTALELLVRDYFVAPTRLTRTQIEYLPILWGTRAICWHGMLSPSPRARIRQPSLSLVGGLFRGQVPYGLVSSVANTAVVGLTRICLLIHATPLEFGVVLTTRPLISSIGVLLARSDLKILRGDNPSLANPGIWRKLWKVQTQERARFFLYLMAHDCILINAKRC
ncbi:hypothetical protein V2J09_006548, partial [Rumex salicifolius]